MDVAAERLHLADWRRQFFELYAEVRRVAVSDPRAAADRWREAREALYRSHAASPVPLEARPKFRAQHFPYDPALRFETVLVGGAAPAPSSLGLPTSLALPASHDEGLAFDQIGWIEVPFPAGARRMGVYWLREYAGGLFLPFRDGTSGHETYGAGRYVLDTAKGADLGGDVARGTIVVDFNFAYQPSCAFDPRWACPLAPRDNWLDVEVRAGERLV